MKELETRSSHLHNQREALKLETKTFRSKLETTQVTQNKLRDTVCESKDRLTNTIAEHRSRWKDSNDAFQSHMRDAEEEHQISFRKLEQVINDGQSLCKNQKKYLESKISLLQEELGNASSNFRELTLEIGILKGDFPREQETTKILEEQLAESKKRENFLKQLEARMVNIFARLEKVDLKAEKAKELPSLISERLVCCNRGKVTQVVTVAG
ncbi:uncharacterized protein CTRU02_204552 [Colletotrichum truncatum]|uniref:Uncharacterized protein n=1 Tax=Colletotrichum truncatum TaxID=5467 RepID=A0ACC3ZCD6_COLTU|nr:uncharacterized protein CTRU02_02782 [Colletotrichum truncatum]KAF6797740.1 hypothetical protein CTRU02_02782 [Colletotrichum truncatum]